MVSRILLVVVLATSADALIVDHARLVNLTKDVAGIQAHETHRTFQSFYEGYSAGHGIFKWNNALDAYQRHFGMLAGRPLSIVEVGVQSGGSLLMWRAVLGQQIKLYGLDINPACKQFQEAGVSITIGDEADTKMWEGFFTRGFLHAAGVNILVDSAGSHGAQMLTTFQAGFPRIRPGGYILIEDITNAHYLESFFKPTAVYLSQMACLGLVDSVHLYPLVMVVRKGGFAAASELAAEGVLQFSGTKIKVANFTAMWTAISTVPPGSQIIVEDNSTLPNNFLADTLIDFFSSFVGLHEFAVKEEPVSCSGIAGGVCTLSISPLTWLQSRVSGVHIYKDYAVVEVPAAPPQIMAIRKGTQWIAR